MNEIYDFLKKAGVYFLGTIDGDRPRVRPFGTIDIYNGKLYILTSKSKDVSKQIEKNHNVELNAIIGGDWIRISAQAYLFDDETAQSHMLDAYPNLKAVYKAGAENTALYELKDIDASIIYAAGEIKKIEV